jgi:hypothetical protein
MGENRIPQKLLYMNLEKRSLRGRPRNKWKDEVREEGRLVSARKGYVTERELLRMAKNLCILHMPML